MITWSLEDEGESLFEHWKKCTPLSSQITTFSHLGGWVPYLMFTIHLIHRRRQGPMHWPTWAKLMEHGREVSVLNLAVTWMKNIAGWWWWWWWWLWLWWLLWLWLWWWWRWQRWLQTKGLLLLLPWGTLENGDLRRRTPEIDGGESFC